MCVIRSFLPENCLYKGVKPTGVLYKGVRPTGVLYKGVRPTGVLYKGVRPTGVLYKGVRPTGVLYKGVRPTGVLQLLHCLSCSSTALNWQLFAPLVILLIRLSCIALNTAERVTRRLALCTINTILHVWYFCNFLF